MRRDTLQLLLGLSVAINVAFTGYYMFGRQSATLQSTVGLRSMNRMPTRLQQRTMMPNRRVSLISRAEAEGPIMSVQDGKFADYRWKEGTWDTTKFQTEDGKVNWDAVIDAEIARRKLVIDNMLPTSATEDVTFNAAEIPWWAWVKRFHLPEAEKLNGRAAMIGYMAALGVDQLTKIGIYDQHTSLWGRLTVAATVIGIFYYREFGYDNLTDEQKMAVDEVKEQLLGFIDQGKKAVGMN
uniref:Uncharacterized protein n=1 Tax=Lotharella oceanica TaxID=641309 RepID=A0A7S2X9E7_9EUKA|mmetsp:Transcript_22074/g.41380  ORF Transcript_22074/g.41380 Transcript_22074/m.41380 type:complete len:239 (+) Transcript_22074:35-751(+)